MVHNFCPAMIFAHSTTSRDNTPPQWVICVCLSVRIYCLLLWRLISPYMYHNHCIVFNIPRSVSSKYCVYCIWFHHTSIVMIGLCNMSCAYTASILSLPSLSIMILLSNRLPILWITTSQWSVVHELIRACGMSTVLHPASWISIPWSLYWKKFFIRKSA